MKLTNKAIGMFALAALIIGSFGISKGQAQGSYTHWDLSGDYVINMDYNGSDNLHSMTLSQDGSYNLTGNGGSPAEDNVYTWEVTSGSISGTTFELDADYTATEDAVDPQTVLHLEGMVAEDGSLSGTWSDNYQGGERSGTWSSESGLAILKNKYPGFPFQKKVKV